MESILGLEALVHPPVRARGPERFHALYAPLIRTWFARFQLPEQDLDGYVRETLALVADLVPDFGDDHTRGFRAWLRASALQVLHDAHRQHRLPPRPFGEPDWGPLLESLADLDGPNAEWWNSRHDRHVALRLMELLRSEFEPTEWRAFEMLVLEDLPAPKVADFLQISVNATYIAKSRILARLRREAAGLLDV